MGWIEVVAVSCYEPVVAATVLGLVALFALRARWRVDSRLRAACAALACALLPVGVGASFAVYGVVRCFRSMALTGSGGVGAMAAGLAESLAPLLVGLVGGAVIALVGLAFAFLHREVELPEPDATASRTGMAAAAVAALLLTVVVVLRILRLLSTIISIVIPGAVPSRASAADISESASSLAARVQEAMLLSATLVVLAIVVFFLACWLRPGVLAAGRGLRVLALVLLLVTLGWTLMTAVRVHAGLVYLMQTGLEGRGTPRAL